MVKAWIDAGAKRPAEIALSQQNNQTASTSSLNTPALPASLAAKPITAVAYSSHGKFAAVARYQTVELVSADSLAEIRRWDDHPGKVHAVAFANQDSQLLAASGVTGSRGEVRIWNLASGKLAKTLSGHRDVIYAMALSPNQTTLATGSYDRNILLWDVQTGQIVRELSGHNGAIYDLAFSPDGQVLVSASADATVKVWSVATGERLDTLSQPLKEQYSVDISPDGQHIIAAGEDNRIRQWQLVSIDTPQINPLLIARFGHEGAIQRIRYSADGRRIVSLASDRTLKVWNAETLTQLHAYERQPDDAQSLTLTPDGNFALVGRMNGSLERFDLRFEVPPVSPSDATGAEADASSSEDNVASESAEIREFTEQEPNDNAELANSVELPVTISGIIANEADDQAMAEDWFRFSANAGQAIMVEVNAARDGSPLDSHIEIRTAHGQPIPQIKLQAVRDSYFTFRGKDSSTVGDFRLHNWEEMQLNQYLYANGEVVKLFHYPRGPDSGFNVYPNFGSRFGFFGTTPIAHALNEPCYIVQPLSPAESVVPNGLPVFTLHYENDDDSRRQWGADSRLQFVARTSGEYTVRIKDARDFAGDDFRYQLTLRTARPNFQVRFMSPSIEVNPGAGRKFEVQLDRMDGFDGEVRLDVTNVPDGISVTSPIVIEAGHQRAWGLLWADENCQLENDNAKSITVTATANVNGRHVIKELGSLGEVKVKDAAPKLSVELAAQSPNSAATQTLTIRPGTTVTAKVRIQRMDANGPISFGKEDALVNSAHGVFVDNTGLNGVLIPPDQTERTIFITAEPWVQPAERWVFVESEGHGNAVSQPILLQILPGE
ncbi:MAG: WD40 repeat domain-containing protein [Pirellulaceae bacterium]